MGKRFIAAAVAAVALLALTGCASAAPETKPTVTFPELVEEQTGTTLAELRDLYVASGGDCDTLRPRAGSRVAQEAADCEDGALLTIYESEAQRDGAIRVLEGLQEIPPASPHVIVVGPDWIVNGSHVEGLADAMGGVAQQIGTPVPEVEFDLTTDAGICAADAELTNLELNDVLAPVLGYPADRDQRTFEQDEAIRAYKNAAFQRECPERAF